MQTNKNILGWLIELKIYNGYIEIKSYDKKGILYEHVKCTFINLYKSKIEYVYKDSNYDKINKMFYKEIGEIRLRK